MATCKDCLHFVVCEEVPTKSADDCDFFKDSSRFEELPCKIGDIVYFGYYLPTIKQYKIDEWIVAKISFINYHLGDLFDSDGRWAVGDKENRIAITLTLSDKSEFSPDSIDVPLKDFRDKFLPPVKLPNRHGRSVKNVHENCGTKEWPGCNYATNKFLFSTILNPIQKY